MYIIGRCCIYIPLAIQHTLKGTRDDVFFKLCTMHGIAYDSNRRVGTLFFLIDSIVGSGAVSIMCISTTRQKVMELAVHVLSFISQQFGKDHHHGSGGRGNSIGMLGGNDNASGAPTWDTVTSTLTKLKSVMRKSDKKTKF